MSAEAVARLALTKQFVCSNGAITTVYMNTDGSFTIVGPVKAELRDKVIRELVAWSARIARIEGWVR